MLGFLLLLSVWFVRFHLVDGLLFVFMISSFLFFLLRFHLFVTERILHRHLFCFSSFLSFLFHFHLFATERSLHRYVFCFSSFLSFVSFSSVCY